MTELAARTFSSRSAMTRRVDRMVEEGLVERTTSAADGRGVVIALSQSGLARLLEAVPVHVRGVSKLFIERFDDRGSNAPARLEKVTLDRSFG